MEYCGGRSVGCAGRENGGAHAHVVCSFGSSIVGRFEPLPWSTASAQQFGRQFLRWMLALKICGKFLGPAYARLFFAKSRQ